MSTLSDAPVPYGTPRSKPAGCDFGGEIGSVTGLPPTLRKKAARNIAGRARDVTDARLLLDVLGLLPKSVPGESAP